MSKQSNRTQFLAGDFISENAVRGAFGRRRRGRTAPRTPADRVNGMPAERPLADQDSPAPSGGPATLRRWSVAELIARAVAAPPTEGMSHS